MVRAIVFIGFITAAFLVGVLSAYGFALIQTTI